MGQGDALSWLPGIGITTYSSFLQLNDAADVLLALPIFTVEEANALRV